MELQFALLNRKVEEIAEDVKTRKRQKKVHILLIRYMFNMYTLVLPILYYADDVPGYRIHKCGIWPVGYRRKKYCYR